jgi:hypothetical protein
MNKSFEVEVRTVRNGRTEVSRTMCEYKFSAEALFAKLFADPAATEAVIRQWRDDDNYSVIASSWR